MPKISVIVPVYNAGIYLEECLKSILQQTFQDIEVILILDCPTDGSDKVCQSFAEKDSRIKIIYNKHNLHIGLSRNRGLDIAQGEYIAFSDDDDTRELNMYEILYNKAKQEDADMVVGLTVNAYKNRHQVFEYPALRGDDFRDFALIDLISCGGFRSDTPLCVNIHPHLYKRSLLDKYQLRFVDTKFIAPEDRLFNIKVLLYARKVILEKTPMYFHRIIQNSESHSQSYFDFNKHVCYVKSVNTLLQYTLTFHLYCLEFYMGAGKLLMSGILNSLIANKSIREFICRIRLLKSDAIFASIFHFYIIPQTDKWHIRFLKKIICRVLR